MDGEKTARQAKLLSVIVPTLDGSVPECVRRLAADPDVELVVVAGVKPVGRARNIGLDRATGEYVAWVDADDEIADDWLAAVKAGIARGVDCVVVDVESEVQGRVFEWKASGRGVFADMVLGRIISAMYGYVVARRLYAGLRFDETRRQTEDTCLLGELLPRVKSAAGAGLRYRYRSSANGLINTSSPEDELAAFELDIEWARRWEGTDSGPLLFAYACKSAGWRYEWRGLRRETGEYLRANFARAMHCGELTLAWKVKIALILLGVVRLLKPLYWLHYHWCRLRRRKG